MIPHDRLHHVELGEAPFSTKPVDAVFLSRTELKMFRRTVCSLTQSAAAAARTQTRQALRLPTNTINKRLLVRQMSDVAAEKNVPTKITKIVDQIATLNLLETASLVAALKTRLNIQDVIMAAPQGASTGASGASGAASVAAPVEVRFLDSLIRIQLCRFLSLSPVDRLPIVLSLFSSFPFPC
ncbi:hypothetical protein BASA81_017856 [Batrachochytrium salamandrivorans]|nr:hypothetical protein BASA81_017856 [Batrachochytrium salamandrivorans]